VLERAGAARCLVALAGDVYAADAPPGQPGWRVEIRGDRTGDDAPPVGVLWLRHAGVSTTGDSEQFVEIDGVRYSHVIDPRTGLGLTDPRMVTVLAPRGMDADALAKGVCVRGVPEAATLAREFNAAFCVVEPDDRGDPARPRRITLHDPRGLFRWHTPPR
jgi:thiamine biosynthesis lipoprotein